MVTFSPSCVESGRTHSTSNEMSWSGFQDEILLEFALFVLTEDEFISIYLFFRVSYFLILMINIYKKYKYA